MDKRALLPFNCSVLEVVVQNCSLKEIPLEVYVRWLRKKAQFAVFTS